ncbi:uncharacterized protein LOC118192738 [Stegodyphus dumicola]|uniref:uncharacterized protein LOC118192738 n=1 Tax=Stegodyphus dumicola TaxID=202533 RepID=UPI0015ACDEFD|nr:uncharacterized protein LOC118192738 [Stegodyphus dumicola]
MLAWILRFIKNCQRKEKLKKTELTYEEVQSAEHCLLKLIQQESFAGRKMKILKNMQTFRDENNIVRLRTKLLLGDEEENFKCPILLPESHEIIHRLVRQKHCELQHVGLRTLIANLREDYWIISINRLAKQVSSSCISCKRFKAKPTEPPFAPLPKNIIKIGSSNALRNLDWEKIMSFSTIKKIKCNFNPPTAAWWGGWWERMVRMLKEMLRRILGRKSLDYEELETILCDCEATINSRPLTYI